MNNGLKKNPLCSWGSQKCPEINNPPSLDPQIPTCIKRMNKHFFLTNKFFSVSPHLYLHNTKPSCDLSSLQSPTDFFPFDLLFVSPLWGLRNIPAEASSLHTKSSYPSKIIFLLSLAVLITIQTTNFKHNSTFGGEWVDSDPEQ